ncbi:prolipoprotein diacylglyceryl transferase [Elizabethkingia anophelis]|nr:prolipoprotein diacylglyceryl transferase [Elizabethkingia anophelis]ELB1891858.1 prolipoprotein diacylglyceryl transferase [Elizabethkingia anophelis]MCT3639394.1 prolipoprotein diacylglyceryl transferase [Elizabethkingia anophelis]MCT4196428.1 prolipoprotein diacylglyceryl transferase [Elizabethkingia anophelis]MCT4225627.1 prolipoprotein diacylglyceryl transferase [Elizabethkingia anophelis]
MNNILLRIYLFVFALFAQGLFSQNHTDGLSDGTLIVNKEKKIPVKIFATTSGRDFGSFAQKPQNSNILIILNSSINEYASTPVFEEYKIKGYKLLNKKFQLADTSNPKDYKYFYKPLNPQNDIEEGAKAELETPYKIWDPSVGFKLGPITLHFYSLMFVFAFGFGYILMKRIFKIDGVDQKYLDPLFTWTLIGTILGARLGHVIFYQPELFKQDFWSVFLPIQTKPEFKFTGFSGLASHGATIALILTTLYYSYKIIKKNPFWVYDRLGIVVALGGAFVRMGNFFNSEIIGKQVDPNSPFAILFPQQSSEYGITVPRYPSQLFEAIGYVLLFILLWFLYRKTDKKYQQGWLFGLFFIILWAIRFFVEFLKEPQGDEFIQFAGLNTGQVLSIPFMLAGFAIMLYSKKNKLEK